MNWKRLSGIGGALAALLVVTLAVGFAVADESDSEHRYVVKKKIELKNDGASGAWLGVTLSDSPKSEGTVGARVMQVMENSPAESAGLKEGDIISAFGGEVVDGSSDLVRLVRRAEVGDVMDMEVQRDGGTMSLAVTLGDKPETMSWVGVGDSPNFTFSRGGLAGVFGLGNVLGMNVQDMSDQLRDYFGVQEGTGILVNEVDEGSAAARAGLQAGDVILMVDGNEVDGSHDLFVPLHELKAGDTVELDVIRDGSRQSIVISVEESDLELSHNIFMFKGDGEEHDFAKGLSDFYVHSPKAKMLLESGDVHKSVEDALKAYRFHVDDDDENLIIELEDLDGLSVEMEELKQQLEELRKELSRIQENQ